MSTDKETFDLAFSLGGSCIAALQLRYRNLRTCSLPFDWLFHVDNTLLTSLATCFAEDFKNWLLYENLLELKGDERGTSPHYQYKDLYTGYRFIHDFFKPLEDAAEYKHVRNRQNRRIKRLYELIEKSTSILMILNAKWKVDGNLADAFHTVLRNKWSGKRFKFVIIDFCQEADSVEEINEDCVLRRYARSENAYDYFKTNFEWEFLDNVVLRENRSVLKYFVSLERAGRRLRVSLLPKAPSLAGFGINVFNFVFQIGIGKEK